MLGLEEELFSSLMLIRCRSLYLLVEVTRRGSQILDLTVVRWGEGLAGR